MRTAEEQVYIALVVVKRPATNGRPELDPGLWAQSVVNGLADRGVQHGEGSRYAPPGTLVQSRFASAVYAALGLVCVAGAACLCYLGVK